MNNTWCSVQQMIWNKDVQKRKKIEQKENKDKIKKRKEKTEEKGEKLRIQQWRHTLLERKETVNNLHR